MVIDRSCWSVPSLRRRYCHTCEEWERIGPANKILLGMGSGKPRTATQSCDGALRVPIPRLHCARTPAEKLIPPGYLTTMGRSLKLMFTPGQSVHIVWLRTERFDEMSGLLSYVTCSTGVSEKSSLLRVLRVRNLLASSVCLGTRMGKGK